MYVNNYEDYKSLGLVVYKNDEKNFVIIKDLEDGLLSKSLRPSEETTKSDKKSEEEQEKEFIYFLKEGEDISKGDIVSILILRKDKNGRKDKVLKLEKPTFKGVITVTGVRNYGFALVNVHGKNASIYLSPYLLRKLQEDRGVKNNFDLLGQEIEFEVKWNKKGLKAYLK